jgi:predicted ABC-type ATPase
MTTLSEAIDRILAAQAASAKPLGIVLAGHNGSGKSTMWHRYLSPKLQMPLINADRMMMSILPERNRGRLVKWAQTLRDSDEGWMRVSQRGVQAFVAEAMGNRLPFAMETVFSHWRERGDGKIESKIDLIRGMQKAGYFVLLCFVGLSNSALSIARVQTRVAEGGHDVPAGKLLERFPRTQRAIKDAVSVADGAVLLDNSLEDERAFSVCGIQLRSEEVFDLRRSDGDPSPPIREWLDRVAPL